MKFKLLNRTINITRDDSQHDIKHEVLDKAKRNAMRGLEQAKLELAVKKRMQELQVVHGRTEHEITGIETGIKQDQSSVHNWTTQLDVINNLYE